MEMQFMVVSNNKIYICNNLDELKTKTSALSTFNISYQVYYKIGQEWINMKVLPQDFMLCAK